jgi:glyceraldehyde 3-phosphate dehydrogenase
MVTRVAINGFGRIGRLLARLILEEGPSGLEIAVVNDLVDPATLAALYSRDSLHGRAKGSVAAGDDWFSVDGRRIAVTRSANPAAMDHAACGVDLVIEASGLFAARYQAIGHITAGAKRVLVSAPAKGADFTVVQGVNHDLLSPEHVVVSNASCTTNALAPIAAVLDQALGIERGHMTTVHAYTNDQRLLDQQHPDLRRARAGAISMIPTSTGATKAVTEVLPQLASKLTGSSIRVPTPNVSLVDFVFNAGRTTTAEEVNAILAMASGSERLSGILAVTDEPLVSVDLNHDPHSVTIDMLETQVTDERLVRILGWYDNEWGFANRLRDTAIQMARQLQAP